MPILEEKIQSEIYLWFHNTYCTKLQNPRCIIFSVPNDTTDVRELMRKKSTGLKAGVSDLIILMPNKILFCEVKTNSGVQSEKQKEFQANVEALGFEYYVVRSLNEFKQTLQLYEKLFTLNEQTTLQSNRIRETIPEHVATRNKPAIFRGTNSAQKRHKHNE